MVRHVLIGVGGSGQHAVLAYLRLLSLSLPGAGELPHVFVLDADADEGKNPSKRSHLIDDIFALHGAMSQGETHPPHCGTLKPYRHESASGKVLLGRLVGESDAARQLAHAFLADDEGDWGNDWAIELDRGMMANPKVGAISLAHKVMGSRDRDDDDTGSPAGVDPQIAALFAALGPSVRVAVVGSSFGGTGSGAIPALLRIIDKKLIDRARAFMTLPWFAIERGADDGREASAAAARDGLDPQERNASLGLHTYWDELTSLRADSGDTGLRRSSYVLCQSMPGWQRAVRRNQGNFDQEEHPHVLNLALAGAMQAFFGLGDPLVSAHRGILYALKSTERSELQGRFDARSSPHLRFWTGPDKSRQLSDLAADAEATAMVLERGGRVLLAAKAGKLSHPSVRDNLNVWTGLLDYVEALRQATGGATEDHSSLLDRLRKVKRLLPEDKVFHVLGQALLVAAGGLRESLLWLDLHGVAAAGADQDQAVGVKGLHAGHLFKPRASGDFRQGVEPIDDEKALGQVWSALGVQATNPQGDSLKGSPVGAQAFLVFVQLFKDNEADDALVQQFNRALAADARGDKAALAARVLAIAAHRRIVGLRRGRLTTDMRDAEQLQDKDDTDGSVSPMLLLRVAADSARDVRLARIDLTKQATGDDPPGPFDAQHPRSLKYLDPYAEFSNEPSDAFDFRNASFPEHGLRAVPNLVAPILLQRWRLRHGLPETETERREPLRQGDGRGARRASKRGIHLHARRVNEAGFWLAVSADQRVRFEPDLLAGGDGTGVFAGLARQCLKEQGIRSLPALVLAGKHAEAAGGTWPVLLWAGDTWVLAANRAARRLFGRLLSELPSVRHAYSPAAPLVLAKQLHADAVTSLDRFFAEELQRLISHVQAVGDAAAVGPLVGLLGEIVTELPQPLPTSAGEGALSLALELALPLPGRNGFESLEVHSPAVLRRLGNYLLGGADSPPIVVSPRLPAGSASETRLETRLEASAGLLPVRAEIWADLALDGNSMLVRKTAAKTPGRSELARCKLLDLTLNLKGLGAKDLIQPFGEGALRLVEREIDWSFSVWPGFQAPGWGYYIVSALCNGSQAVNDDPVRWNKPTNDLVFVVFGHPPGSSSGPLRELATVIRGLPVRVRGVPVAIELRCGRQVLGSQPVRLRAVTSQGRAIDRIGVDFGTSNTCVAFQPSGQAGGAPRTEMVALLARSTDAISFSASAGDGTAARAAFLAETGNFFQARSALAPDAESAVTIPSELLASLHDNVGTSADQRAVLGRVYRDGAKAYVDVAAQGELHSLPLASPFFTPLPNKREGLTGSSDLILWLANMVRAGEDRIFGDLKWERSGDNGLEVSRQLRALYLEHVLVAALAELRQKGFDSFAEFVATQPEARTGVNDHFPNSFAGDLQRLLLTLCDATGIRWEGTEPVIVSETAAALLMYHLESEDQPHSALTIDIGGGTTDVGVLLNAPGAAPGQGENDGRRFTASARFAGNQLLRAVVELREVKNALAKEAGGAADLSLDARAAMLKAQLRNSFAIVQHERVQAVTEMFFDATFEYALRVLILFAETRPGWQAQFVNGPPGQRLKVKLLGNGFKLFGKFRLGGADPDKALQTFLAGRLARAVEAGMLSPALAARLSFEVEPNSKADLISVGAFNAVTLRHHRFKPGAGDVLVPGCLVTNGGGPTSQPRATATRVDVDAFGEHWLARPHGGGPPTQRLRLLLDAEAGKRLFPLTLRYWGGQDKGLDALKDVFLSDEAVAEQYLDFGALYLTGVSRMNNSKSFAWLMDQQVQAWSK